MTQVLVLVDLQNDYFRGGAMELVDADPAVANAAFLLEIYRRRALPIFHVQHIAKRPGATFFLPRTRGADLHESVQPAAGECIVTKHFPNAFRDTPLLAALRTAGASSLAFAGMMTHLCVDTTVRAASDLGFQCVVAQDACATKALTFGGHAVDARDVQVAYLAGLNGAFANVCPAREIGGAL